jgi:DNA-binding PadR family transcriptional regulator
MKVSSQQTSPLSAAVVHILLALASGDLHGYGIIQEVARHSNGRYKLGPGTLYDNLKKLMDAGLVADVPKSDSAAEEERRLYRLTADGRSALAAEVERLQSVVKEAKLRLQELHLNEVRPRI